MAIMIPSEPRDFDQSSNEGIAFEALKKIEGDDYYVIHSLSLSLDSCDKEADFVIYNRYKGILVLEVKNSSTPSYRNGNWFYDSGKKMKHNGPYNQALSYSHKLMQALEDKEGELGNLINSCQFTYGVWFLGMPEHKFLNLENNNSLPLNCHSNRTLFKEHLTNPELLKQKIDSIFEIDTYHKTRLSTPEHELLFNNFINPEFRITKEGKELREENNIRYEQYTKEQFKVLNLLDLSNFTAINGGAGTGKTVLAIERAKELAANYEKVLFICYNRKLYDELNSKYANEFISFYTARAFISAFPQDTMANYILCEGQEFPFDHIIIDEGQDISDYNSNSHELDNLLSDFRDIVEKKSSTYKTLSIFYDEFQLVNGRDHLPDVIKNADCKFTLTKNCRNTTTIAQTSLKLLKSVSKNNDMYDKIIARKLSNITGYREGEIPEILFIENIEKQKIINHINTIIESWKATKEMGATSNITILTCNSTNAGQFQEEQRNGFIKIKGETYKFANCSTFKGLEADGIIMIEMVPDSIMKPEYAMTSYVGASRAKTKLAFVIKADKSDCKNILENTFEKKVKPNMDTQILLARELNCNIIK